MAKFLIEGGKPLSGKVTPSGNKNEALPVIAACLLTDQEVVLQNVPKISDVLDLCQILAELGAKVEWTGPEELRIQAKNIRSHKPDFELCSRIRASILLLGPLLARVGEVELPLPGGDVIGSRRIDTHFEGLRTLGAELLFGNPIRGSVEKTKAAEMFLDEPSVTATENILMLAVTAEGHSIIHNAASEPHVVGLCKLLNAMGAKITGIGSNRLDIEGVKSLKGATHRIGPDFMELGSFLSLGSIAGGELEITCTDYNDLRFILKTFAKLGIVPLHKGQSLFVDGRKELRIEKDLGEKIPTIYSGPWPGFPTDLMSVAIIAATQAHGNIIIHEKMFEGRMFFTDNLMSMGANIVLCDPHRIVVNGKSQLRGAKVSSPDVRAGMAVLIAALIAQGQSEINNIQQIERGYANIEGKLRQLGAQIERVD